MRSTAGANRRVFRFFRRQKQEAPGAPPAPDAPPEPAAAAAIAEEVEEQKQKVEQSLQPTRRSIFSQIGELFASDEITSTLWDELQDLLVLGDCGVDTTN